MHDVSNNHQKRREALTPMPAYPLAAPSGTFRRLQGGVGKSAKCAFGKSLRPEARQCRSARKHSTRKLLCGPSNAAADTRGRNTWPVCISISWVSSLRWHKAEQNHNSRTEAMRPWCERANMDAQAHAQVGALPQAWETIENTPTVKAGRTICATCSYSTRNSTTARWYVITNYSGI